MQNHNKTMYNSTSLSVSIHTKYLSNEINLYAMKIDFIE